MNKKHGDFGIVSIFHIAFFVFIEFMHHSFDCECASTIQSNLSTPREISVNRSAVSASPDFPAVSMAARVVAANSASEAANLATCSFPDNTSKGEADRREFLV